ncbi:NRDE protein-domain-containing protein [Diplogelasinospora grovesii]|uniref:NRDE protein-domain-containing protein n=1 Tax=Diplogelasinospora grovesii TaxID=303347 RepID=A0AAN6N2D6_9PEZI|nr:NRDE protein-domain-containing protein [Diplogelasinospora grovesii]
MCIVLLTTSHPKYALVVINNRDEFILRPTSKLHWWTTTTDPGPQANGSSSPSNVEILSSRDLQRAEQGTWHGITKGGNFAVLTNYRETDTHDAAHPVHGQRSRGGMVTAWLGAHPSEPTADFVHRMLDGGDMKHIGGFSLICGKLRKRKGRGESSIEPLAIISNRNDCADDVPWICGGRGEVYGLSNTCYVDADRHTGTKLWPKVQNGQDMVTAAINTAIREDLKEDELVDALLRILSEDTFPHASGMEFEESIPLLKHSIFIPAFGGTKQKQEMEAAVLNGTDKGAERCAAIKELKTEGRPDEQANGFMTGLYGTQRQTVLLVDWDGNVRYTERNLWDAQGNPIERGAGDTTVTFSIEGWNSESES